MRQAKSIGPKNLAGFQDLSNIQRIFLGSRFKTFGPIFGLCTILRPSGLAILHKNRKLSLNESFKPVPMKMTLFLTRSVDVAPQSRPPNNSIADGSESTLLILL